jgi:hypothetical protein
MVGDGYYIPINFLALFMWYNFSLQCREVIFIEDTISLSGRK